MSFETVVHDNRLTDAGLRIALKRVGAAVESPATLKRPAGIGVALVDIATELHARNREAGWWTSLVTGEPLQRNTGELLMLMVSELGEIPPYPTSETEMDDKLPHRLMIEVELADCAIRIFDTFGALAPLTHQSFVYGLSLPLIGDAISWHQIDYSLMRIVRFLSQSMEGHRKSRVLTNIMAPDSGDVPAFDHYLGLALFSIFDLGWRLGLDVPGAIAEKAEYNQQREDHKIEVRKRDGGKAY